MSSRFLVIQTAFLGDGVLSLPFLARLFELYPDARVDLVAHEAAGIFELARERGLSRYATQLRVHRFEKRGRHAGFSKAAAFMREVRGDGAPFDAAFCLQRSLRSAALALLSGARERVGFSSGAAAFLYTRLARRAWDNGRSEVEKNLDLLRAFSRSGVAPWSPRAAPSILASTGPRPAAKDAPVLLSLGSPWPTKRWPLGNAARLCENLTRAGVEVRLIGDAATRPLAEAVKQKVPSLLLKDLTGQTNLREWVDQIQSARVLVSGDSAAVHVASDLNVPVIALFGPTVPDFGFAPWRVGSEALGVSNLPCRPCHIHGPRACPLKHHKCLKDLTAESVETALKPYLGADSYSL